MTLVTKSNSSGTGMICEKINGFIISDIVLTAGENKEASIGILVDGCRDSKIEDVFCVGFAEYGISIRNYSYLMNIAGCHLAGNGKVNLHLENINLGGELGELMPNLISNCIIYGGGKGISLTRASVVNIVGCSVYQTGDASYHLDRSNSVLISGCRSFQITGPAVLVEGAHEFNCIGNIFCWHTEQGIIFKNAKWGNITGNEVIDNGSYNSGEKFCETSPDEAPQNLKHYNGIEMFNVHGYRVGGNTIFNWEAATIMLNGITEDSQSSKNMIDNNNINYFSGNAVVSEGQDSEVRGIVALKDRAHIQGKKKFVQSFRSELTKEFVEMQQKQQASKLDKAPSNPL